jgi:hypothetical protein
MDSEHYIREVCQEINDLLISKNKAYGDTAINPPKIFSTLSPKQGILARIDDKLSRIKTKGYDDVRSEDTLQDLIGYLILLKVQLKKEEHEEENL